MISSQDGFFNIYFYKVESNPYQTTQTVPIQWN
jgi:hypothetical protein